MPFDYTDLLLYIVMSIAIVSLLYGSYTDIKHRTVKSILFIPLALSGFALNYYLQLPVAYLAAGLIIFLLSFLDPETYAYEIVALVFLIVSVFVIIDISHFWGFQLLVMSVVYLIGFQERLFGIGDIKAIIALMYSSSLYSPIVGYVTGNSLNLGIIPTSVALLTNISVFAIVFVSYAIYLAYRHGSVAVRGQPFAIKYDLSLHSRNPAAYREGEKDGTKFLIYRIPFIVPIALGYLLFIITGFWPAIL